MSIHNATERIKKALNDTTTADNITYLPSGFASAKKALKTLSRMKNKWKIEIIGEGNGYHVRFGNVLGFSVANELWEDFAKNVLGDQKIVYSDSFEIDLGRYLMEAKEDDVASASKEVTDALYKVLLKDPIKSAGANIAVWNNLFPKIRYSTGDNVLIKFETMQQDVKALLKKISLVYSDDRGMLELISSTLEQLRPLGTFDGFASTEFFIGTRIESMYQKIPIAYETLVDMSFVPREHVVIKDQDVLDNIAGTPGVRVATNTVFPTGKQFDKKHFQAIKNAIDDSIK